MNKRILWVEYLGFITIGMVANLAGPSLVAIRSALHLNYSQSGLIISGQFFGMLFSVLLGGYITDHFGKKPYILAGSFFLTLGMLGSMLSNGYAVLLSAVIITGVGYGCYAVGINSLCADFVSDNHGKALNLLHLFFCFGAIAGPILVTIGLNFLHNWRIAFGFVGFFPLIVAGLLWPVQIRRTEAASKSIGSSPFRTTFLWAMGLTAFIYVGTEVSVYGWLPTLWKSLFKTSIIPASLTTTFFWVALMLGRMTAGRLSDRIGLSRYLTMIATGVLLTTLLWWGTISTIWCILVVFIIGLFLAGIFPTIMAVTTSHFPNRTGEISAFITTFAALGGFLIPSGIGPLADAYGLGNLPPLVGVLAFFLVLGTLYAWNAGRKQQTA